MPARLLKVHLLPLPLAGPTSGKEWKTNPMAKKKPSPTTRRPLALRTRRPAALPKYTEAEVEAIKLDYLERGIARGKTRMRTDTVFDLYLQRADPTTADDGYQRAAMLSSGVPVGPPGVPVWKWWAVGKPGHEVCLGDVAVTTVVQALQKYLELLPLDTLTLVGGQVDGQVDGQADNAEKETADNG